MFQRGLVESQEEDQERRQLQSVLRFTQTQKVRITIITYFWMFPFIIDKWLNSVTIQLPLDGKIK